MPAAAVATRHRANQTRHTLPRSLPRPDGDRTPEQKDVAVAAAGGPHPRRARQGHGKIGHRERKHQRQGNDRIPQGDSQHQRLRNRVERVAQRDGGSAARLLRLGRLLNTVAASLAVSAPNRPRSALLALNTAAPSSSDSAAATGPATRIASAATLRDTPASSSPAPTDMAIAMRWCRIRENDPAITPTSSPTEDTAPSARAPPRLASPDAALRHEERTPLTLRSCWPEPLGADRLGRLSRLQQQGGRGLDESGGTADEAVRDSAEVLQQRLNGWQVDTPDRPDQPGAASRVSVIRSMNRGSVRASSASSSW